MPPREPGRADLVLAFVAVAVLVTGVELVARGGDPTTVLTGLGAAAALGLLHGLAWHVVLRLPSRLPTRWAWFVPAVVACAVIAWLVLELGVRQRLGTRDHGLAMAALLGSVLAGGGVGVTAWWWSARPGAPARWLEASERRRALVGAMLVLGSVAATWLDRTLFPGFHPAAHTALRAASLAGLALVVSMRWPRTRPPVDGLSLLAALLGAAIPFAALDPGGSSTVRTAWDAPLSDEGLRTLRALTDYDGDGHSRWLGGGDCDPMDPAIHPGAVEIAGNGIDDDCVGGDASPAFVDVDAVPVPTTPSPRSVLLVTIETLRADHLGLYGYTRDTSPHLDAWSTKARVFDRAFTPGAWTSIAIPAILRGVHPRRLSWRPVARTSRGRLVEAGEPVALDPGEQGLHTYLVPAGGPPPLPWWLRRRGMVTAAVVDDRFSELLDPSGPAADGFDTFVDADAIPGSDPDDLVVDLAIETLHGLPRDRPFFLWVHLFGPHSPNTAHEGVKHYGDRLVDGYDHEIRFVDAQLHRLLKAATSREPALVWVVTADHGEVLLEHDRMHGFDLSEPAIRVPLVVGGTALPPGREPGLVSTVDLFPTIMGLTETPRPDYLDGLDLEDGPPPDDRVVLVDTWHRDFAGAVLFDQAGITDGRYELVLERTKNTWHLLDLSSPSRSPTEILAVVDPEPWRTRVQDYVSAPALQMLGDRSR